MNQVGFLYFMNLDISCVYKITSPTNKVYVGQTYNLRKRLNHYKRLLCKRQPKLYNSLLKHGYDNHSVEVLAECGVSELNRLERHYQIAFDCIASGLNLTLVRSDDHSGKMSNVTKKKLSVANSGIKNGMYGKKITEKVKSIQREKLGGENNYLSKWILNTETGIYYPCLSAASESCNMKKGVLWAALVKYKVNRTNFIYA